MKTPFSFFILVSLPSLSQQYIRISELTFLQLTNETITLGIYRSSTINQDVCLFFSSFPGQIFRFYLFSGTVGTTSYKIQMPYNGKLLIQATCNQQVYPANRFIRLNENMQTCILVDLILQLKQEYTGPSKIVSNFSPLLTSTTNQLNFYA